MDYLDALFLILVANGAPVVLARLLGDRFAFPLDAYRCLDDGFRILGNSKTLRGLVVSVATTSLAAVLIGHSAVSGLLVGTFAMLGDLSTSFAKRRLRLAESSRAFALDTLPEAMFPTVALAISGLVTAIDVVTLSVGFVLTAAILSPVLHSLGVRRQPY